MEGINIRPEIERKKEIVAGSCFNCLRILYWTEIVLFISFHKKTTVFTAFRASFLRTEAGQCGERP